MNILREAERLVSDARRAEYGPVQDSLSRVALFWSQILGSAIEPEEVCLCMIALKLLRETYAHKLDNLVDIAGYAQLAQWAHDGTEPSEDGTEEK